MWPKILIVIFCGLFSRLEYIIIVIKHYLKLFIYIYAQFWVFSDVCTVSLMTSQCHSVGFCIALCVVSTQNFRVVQSKACISAAKYKHLSGVEAMLKWFSDHFHWEENEMEKTWWRKCQSSEGTSDPVKIQIWARHSGVSVSNSTAYCQYCCFCSWSVAKNWKHSMETMPNIVKNHKMQQLI